MKVIVCGAGQVGNQIARHLAIEEHDVTIIDRNASLVRNITEELDLNGVTGYASHPEILDQAGARDADMIIAATHSDEVNMITCQVAHSVFSVPRKIARIRAQSYLNDAYSDLYRQDHLPIDVIISPELEVAEAVMRRLKSPAAFDVWDFHNEKVQLIGLSIEEDCAVINTPLRQLSELFSTLKAIIGAVRRENRLFVPDPDDQLYVGDQVYVFALQEDIERTYELFGKVNKKTERVILIGGGNVGLSLAHRLEQTRKKTRIKIIERDQARAEFVADALERTVVLLGDGMNLELLEEAGVENADAVIAVTDDDRVNLLSSARAKSLNVPLTIALTNDVSIAQMQNTLGIDVTINPRTATVSSILSHLRHGRVRSVYSIGDNEAEVIESLILPTTPLAGKAVHNINLPEGAIIGAIQKNNEILIPRPDTVLQPDDIVTIFALREDIAEVEKLFQVSIDYF